MLDKGKTNQNVSMPTWNAPDFDYTREKQDGRRTKIS